jgi:hypothetical protein
VKAKQKLCSRCEDLKFIWKNDAGNKYCKECWMIIKSSNADKKQKVYKPIAQRSSKRIKEDKEYSLLRMKYLTTHPLCEAKIPNVCKVHSTDVHHTHSGSDRSTSYLKDDTWKAVCRNCHNWIHNHPKESRELGLLK